MFCLAYSVLHRITHEITIPYKVQLFNEKTIETSSLNLVVPRKALLPHLNQSQTMDLALWILDIMLIRLYILTAVSTLLAVGFEWHEQKVY